MADDYFNSSLTGAQIESALLIAKKIGETNGDVHSNGSGQASGITKSAGEVFVAHYDHTGFTNTTYSDVLDAYNAGKIIVMMTGIIGNGILVDKYNSSFRFASIIETGDTIYISILTSSGWTTTSKALQNTSQLVTSINISSDNQHYPTAKAVYDAIQEGKDTTVEIFEYGATGTFTQVAACVTAGKYPILKNSAGKFFLYMNKERRTVVSDPIDIYQFAFLDVIRNSMTFAYCGENDFWASSESVLFETTSNKVNSIVSPNTTQYPTTKAVYDLVASVNNTIPIVLEYGSTDYTYSELRQLILLDHRMVFVVNTNGEVYAYRGSYISGSKNILAFVSVDILNYGIKYVQFADDESWGLYSSMARSTSVSSISTDNQYPTAKATYAAILNANKFFDYDSSATTNPTFSEIYQVCIIHSNDVRLYVKNGNYHLIAHCMGIQAKQGTSINEIVFMAYDSSISKFVKYAVDSTNIWTRTELS